MDYVSLLQHSIDTSISMKLFKNKQEALIAHIYNAALMKLPMKTFYNVTNFDSNRLQKTITKAYPINNRPRGINDIKSVKYHQKQKDMPPIWLLKRNNTLILLDGAHRIVANYILGKQHILAYVINE